MHALLPDHACLQASAGRWGPHFTLDRFSLLSHQPSATGRTQGEMIPIEVRSPRPSLKPLSCGRSSSSRPQSLVRALLGVRISNYPEGKQNHLSPNFQVTETLGEVGKSFLSWDFDTVVKIIVCPGLAFLLD